MYIMKKYIGYTLIALFATLAVSTAASNEDMMQDKEKAAWQAFKDKKPDDFKKIVSPKFVGFTLKACPICKRNWRTCRNGT